MEIGTAAASSASFIVEPETTQTSLEPGLMITLTDCLSNPSLLKGSAPSVLSAPAGLPQPAGHIVIGGGESLVTDFV